MVYESNEKALYIFGGMEDSERYLSDVQKYDLDTNTDTELFSSFSTSGGPDKMFAQRAVIDPALKEIYM